MSFPGEGGSDIDCSQDEKSETEIVWTCAKRCKMLDIGLMQRGRD